MKKSLKNAVVTLAVGLALNIILGVSKLVVGVLSESVSVASDAVNNLSDSAVSVVTIVAVWLSSRAADHDHPFGHGRYEYIAAFVLGAVIAAVAVELFISGVKRIVTPVDIDANAAMWATLGGSVAIKSFMTVFYRVRSRSGSGSDVIRAASVDSFSDAIVTALVLACMLAERFTGVHIDGYASLAVSVFILVTAIKIIKTMVSRLLGERPDPELDSRITEIITGRADVVSAHDLAINDYGPAHKIAEVDVVFPAKMSFVDVHTACDALEREVFAKTGVRLCVHADPDIADDERLCEISSAVGEALAAFGATAHDISVDDEARCVRLDVLLPGDNAPRTEIVGLVTARVRAVLDYSVEVDIDYI